MRYARACECYATRPSEFSSSDTKIWMHFAAETPCHLEAGARFAQARAVYKNDNSDQEYYQYGIVWWCLRDKYAV